MIQIIPPDISLYLCRLVRDRIGVQADIRIPDGYDGSKPLVVIRDDGGTQSNRIMFDRSIGVSVYGYGKDNTKPLYDLAAQVYANLTDDNLAYMADSPIAAVIESGCNGIYPVDTDLPCALYYMTAEYSTVGSWQ